MRALAVLFVFASVGCTGRVSGSDGGSGDGGPDGGGGDGGSDAGYCISWSPLKNVYYGDLHIHTSWSYDAYAVSVGNRNDPSRAYDFARGGTITHPTGSQIALRRPLDFAAVTDHSEWLGETWLCTDPSSSLFSSTFCQDYRLGSTTVRYVNDAGVLEHDPQLCSGGICDTTAQDVWQRTVAAAEAAYDRTPQCTFTAFVGYEYSGVLTSAFANLHRCVIFRNATVPSRPVNCIDEPNPSGLWQSLRTQCLDAGTGCDLLVIPHNTNRGRGLRFQWSPGGTAEEALDMSRIEPLAEVYQHKGSSECKPGLGTTDPLCAFEQVEDPLCPNPDGGVCLPECTSGGFCNGKTDFLRNALKEGLRVEAEVGENPFKLGFVASTDDHTSAPGSTDEDQYRGHLGLVEGTPAARLANGPTNGSAGLAAVWAHENTRDSLFDALLRRETYATSGPRITVRFFGGAQLPTDLCQRADLVEVGYRDGVPMGGTLRPVAGVDAPPRFVVSALADPGTVGHPGAPLQRIQIVKGWTSGGQTFETVYEVAGNAANGASVDPLTCQMSGTGAASLCTVWTDPSFQASQGAFYYARVVENPSCRWSGFDCAALRAGGAPPAICDNGELPLVTQERAWTSPIWYRP